MIAWLVEAFILGASGRLLEEHDESPVDRATVFSQDDFTCICPACNAAARVVWGAS